MMTATVLKKERNSNLELYRIIVMLLIVAHHYVVNSGLLPLMAENPNSADSIFLYLFGMWGKTGINCFVLITGYFMCQSQITVRKALQLLLEVEFYSLVIYLVFVFSGYEIFSVKELIKHILPVKSIGVGFTSCFLVFYLFIPFLTEIVQNLKRESHKRLLLLCLGTYTGLSFFPFISVTMNYVTWFCILFLLASYIRMYESDMNLKNVKWGGVVLICVFLSILSVLFLPKIGLAWSFLVSDSNALLAVLTSVSSFMFFKDLHIKQSKWINIMGGSTFGVLLIHANSDTMRQWLWKDTLDNIGQYGSNTLVAHALLSVLVIFFVCIIIDQIRIHFIEKPIFKYIDKLLVGHNIK